MGLLDQLLGGDARDGKGDSQGGGISPVTMALLAILAYRTYQGKGRLADMLGRGDQDGDAAGNAPGANPTGGNAMGGNTGGLGGLLGGNLGGLLAGGAAGGLLSGGLAEILKQFEQHGRGEAAQSWIGRGENRPLSEQDVEETLGADTVNSLAEQAGMPRDEILRGLSQGLPQAIDQLTPDGRLPTDDEAGRWV